MKKGLLFLTAVSLTTASFAQITQANEPAIGATASMFLCDSSTNNMNNVTGGTAVWDYSDLIVYPGEMRDIDQLDATTTANASEFPTSVAAFSVEGLITTYLTSNASYKNSQGFVYNEPSLGDVIATWTTDEATMMSYPMSLGGTATDNYAGELEVSISPNPFPTTGTITTTFDGMGTMMFPNSVTVNNVSRIKTVNNATADGGLFGMVNVVITSYDYFDFATTNLPIFSITNVVVTSALLPDPLETQLVLSKYVGHFLDVESKEEVEFSMYPNPSNGEFTINGDFQEANVQVVSQVGHVVYSGTSQAGKSINLGPLNAGMYLVTVEVNGTKSVKNLVIR